MNFASAFLLLVCVVSIAGRAASSGKMCGSPLLPLKGQVTGGVRPAYELGGFVEYICDYGFVNGGGPTVAVCIYSEQRGAHWNLPPPNCIRKLHSAYGIVYYTQMHAYTIMFQVACMHNFEDVHVLCAQLLTVATQTHCSTVA